MRSHSKQCLRSGIQQNRFPDDGFSARARGRQPQSGQGQFVAPRCCRRTFVKRADTQYWDAQIAIPSGIRMLQSPRRNLRLRHRPQEARQSRHYRRIREQCRLPRAAQCRIILCSINANGASGWVLSMAVFPILFGFLACAVTSLALGITVIRLLRIELNQIGRAHV